MTKPKIRIQLLDDDLRVLEDRLVDQNQEFIMGPKKQHLGPTRFEVTFQTSNDIDSFSEYLKALKSALPVKEIGTRGRPSSSTTNDIESPREDILVNVEEMSKKGLTQDDIIKYLRKMGFIFLLTEDFLRYFPEFKFKSKDIGDPNNTGQYLNSFSWLTRAIKLGKDPKTDKYDKMIIFGFDLTSKSSKIIPYLYGERKDIIKSEKSKKSFSAFKELTRFPHYMLEEERLKFSTELRQLMYSESKKPSKFFLRWEPDVKFPTDLKTKVEEILNR